MRHDFEQLGADRFQEFCQALLLRQHPELSCLPIGMPDGGRDAVQKRAISGAGTGGILVFQVKYAERPDYLDDAEAWAVEALEKERKKIAELAASGVREYVLMTNLPGSPHRNSGSYDKVQKVLDSLPLPARCLWRADLDRRLETQWDLKWAYPDLMTGTDLIHALVEGRLSEHAERRSRAIRAFCTRQYSDDREVHFKQADLHNELLDVFVDVPLVAAPAKDDNQSKLSAQIFALARRVSHRRERYYRAGNYVGAGEALLHSSIQSRAPKIVIEGAPGQGKSTLAQYVCQVHRLRLLDKAMDRAAVPPRYVAQGLRVPFKVDLREFAQWLEGVSPFGKDAPPPEVAERSLEGFLAAMVRNYSGGAAFDVSDLHAVVDSAPVFLALDGLDEVVDVGNRENIVKSITASVDRLDGIAQSLQVLVTTRPASFTSAGRFPSPAFEYLRLGDLHRALVDDYRDRWMAALDLNDGERQEITATLDEKLGLPHFRDLARNPMQLAILLGLIHRKGPALPDKRTALYQDYMAHFLDREAAKSNAVRDHRELLLLLHGHLAWKLHAEAERSPGSGGRIKDSDLVRVVGDYLESRGHDRDLFSDLFGRVIDRFGALNSRLDGTLEFEVQPLREYFAAYYLYTTAPYCPPGTVKPGTLPDRLDGMLPRPLWLNVARFYAGFYSVGELPSLIDRIEVLAEDGAFALTSRPRIIAGLFLADRTFTQDRRSLKKAVAVLSKGFGSRHAVGLTDSGYFDGDIAVALPEDGGAPELFEEIWSAVDGGAGRSGEGSISVAEVIRSNSSLHERTSRWLDGCGRRSGPALDRWFEFGEDLGVLGCVPREDFPMDESNGALSASQVGSLLGGGAYHVFDDSQESVDTAVDSILDDRVVFEPDRADSHPLFGLNDVVNMSDWALSLASYYALPDDRPPMDSEGVGYYGSVNSVRSTFEGSFLARIDHINKDITAWDEVIEQGRLLFGERAAFDRTAVFASAVRDVRVRGGGHGDLFDDQKSLCRRARFARHRGNDASWWEGLFEVDGRTERQTLLATSLLLMWGSREVILALQRTVSPIVEAFDQRGFAFVARSVSEGHRFFAATAPEGSNQGRLRRGDLGDLTARMYALLAGRMTGPMRRSVYPAGGYSSSQSDRFVVRQLLGAELEPGPGGQVSWDRVLRLLAQSALLRQHEYGVLIRTTRLFRMPIEVAERVVNDPATYPLVFVAMAERRLENRAVSRSRRVADIAASDGWFAEEVALG